MLKFASALHWFTGEFGLIQSNNGLQIYGAGIISSKGKSIYSLESEIPICLEFDLNKVIKTEYETDSFQKTYFVIKSFQQLFDMLNNLDWKKIKQ